LSDFSHHRFRVQENGLIESSAKKLRGGTYKYFVRGQDELPSQDDFKIEHVRKQQLRPYDAFLKKFQYHDALNAALEVHLQCGANCLSFFFRPSCAFLSTVEKSYRGYLFA
jgi:U3 small nucleolar RNA-associated protein 15